jgi:hypothetical protein
MKLNVKTKEIVDVKGTLLDELNFPIGQPVKAPFRELNRNSVRAAVLTLNKHGYNFRIQDDGLSDYLLVTRNK